jgi:hypothetical protein
MQMNQQFKLCITFFCFSFLITSNIRNYFFIGNLKVYDIGLFNANDVIRFIDEYTRQEE